MNLPDIKNDEQVYLYSVEMRSKGYKKKEIAEILGINQKVLYRKLKKFNFSIYKKRDTIPPESVELDVVDLYTNSNMSVNDLVKHTGHSLHTIRKILDKYDISRKTLKEYREFGTNNSAFYYPEEEECAYFYGWLVSDGCLSDNGVVTLSVKTDDNYILYQLRDYISSRTNVYNGTQTDKRTGAVYNKSSFSFKHDGILERLKNFGLAPRKSTKEVCPEVFKLNKHFWRGMLDGDGHISKSSNEIALVGSQSIVEDFGGFCKNICEDVKPRFYVKGNLHVISVCSKTYSKIILDELYSDSKFKLERKYNSYLEKYYGIDR